MKMSFKNQKRRSQSLNGQQDDCTFCGASGVPRWLLLLFVTGGTSLVVPTTVVVHGNPVITLDIHPTAAIAVQRRRRISVSSPIPDDWFHPNSNAIYATIPKKEDMMNRRRLSVGNEADEEAAALQDFHDHRHLSRYERQYRVKLGLDLEKGWEGFYQFDVLAKARMKMIESDIAFTNVSSSHFAASDYDTANIDNLRGSIRKNIKSDFSGTKATIGSNFTTISNSTTTNDLRHRHDRHRHRHLGSSSTYLGGYFNNYQAVPLSQGYGTHYANVWVGSPNPQRKTAIVDTGSHYTAFPCTGCQDCGSRHHTDPYFDPSKSESFRELACGQCEEQVSCVEGQCIFSQSYTEGSSWKAFQVKDKFYCGGTDVLGAVDPKDQAYSIDFMFGCQISSTGLFITQLADGIMGMSAHETTLPKQLYNKGKIEHNMFAMCFRRELGSSKRGVTAGSMTLGGYSNSLDTSPMIYAKNIARAGFFTVYVKNIFIRTNGGQSAKTPTDGNHQILKVPLNLEKVNSGKGVIVDSGTTDTYLNKHMASSFSSIWKKVTGKEYSNSPMRITKDQLKRLPTVLVQCDAYDQRPDPSKGNPEDMVGHVGKLDPFSPRDLLIAIPATNYMEYSPKSGLYASRLYFSETNGGVLGSNTMQGHNVVFDWGNKRVGFAESSCTYDKDNIPQNAGEEDILVNDCNVGEPVLSETCLSTVDKRLCRKNPKNVALVGMETWTMIVDSPGTESGLSCVEAAYRKTKSRTPRDPSLDGHPPSTIHCDGNGLCHEHRPCDISCPEVNNPNNTALIAGNAFKVNILKAKAAAKSSSLNDNNDSSGDICGDTFWSSCDYNCSQSRIISTPFADGFCHEATRMERTCHKDACGRSDPCRVPFIVHAILVFRGVNVSSWTKHAEDVLVEGFTKTVHALSANSNSTFFQFGDISIRLPRPWVPGDGENDDIDEAALDNEIITPTTTVRNRDDNDKSEEYGVKVSVEVSIFNPSAVFQEQKRQAAETTKGTAETTIRRKSVNTTTTNKKYKVNNRTELSFNNTKYIFSKMIDNITAIIQYGYDPVHSQSTCEDSDLYSLARNAREVAHVILGRDDFMKTLIENMQRSDLHAKDVNNNHSTFRPIYENELLAKKSHLVSSWTIRTDVDDTINYYGPPEPLYVTALRFFHRVAFVTLSASITALFYSLVAPTIETLKAFFKDTRRRLPGLHRSGALYRLVCYDSDSDEENHISTTQFGDRDQGTNVRPSPTRGSNSNYIRRRSPGSSDDNIGSAKADSSIHSIELTNQRSSTASTATFSVSEQRPLNRKGSKV